MRCRGRGRRRWWWSGGRIDSRRGRAWCEGGRACAEWRSGARLVRGAVRTREPVPRAQCKLVGRVILDDALQRLVRLTVANRRTQKGETLAEASGRLAALRRSPRSGAKHGLPRHDGRDLAVLAVGVRRASGVPAPPVRRLMAWREDAGGFATPKRTTGA